MIGKLEKFSTVFLILGGRNLTDVRLVYVTVEFIGYMDASLRIASLNRRPSSYMQISTGL